MGNIMREHGVVIVLIAIIIIINIISFLIEAVDAIKKKSETNILRKKLEDKENDLCNYEKRLESKEKSYKRLEIEFAEQRKKLDHELMLRRQEFNVAIDKQRKEMDEEIKRRLEDIDKIMYSHSQEYPYLAQLFADYNYLKEDNTAYLLAIKKPHPALKASEELRRIAKEKRAIEKQCKAYEYQLNFYETCFPNLEEFKEIQPNEAYQYYVKYSEDDAHEYYREWLNPQEFAELSNSQKLQLKFERYLKRKNKTSWDIGIEYERYIGYKYEVNGYKVYYEGALKKLDDRGRDIIVEREDDVLVIQCKRWAQEKTIHEKHIMQLFGSVTLLNMEKPKNYKGVFITTAQLSETAKYFAEKLDIQVVQNYAFRDYPMIKCNISPEGEKIYHLPFDQQYDRIHIDLRKGNCYVSTIAEAEEKGFRHAYRWQGN